MRFENSDPTIEGRQQHGDSLDARLHHRRKLRRFVPHGFLALTKGFCSGQPFKLLLRQLLEFFRKYRHTRTHRAQVVAANGPN
jgi:hypothetical protein